MSTLGGLDLGVGNIPSNAAAVFGSIAMNGDEYVRCLACGYGGCDVRVSGCGCTMHAVRSSCSPLLSSRLVSSRLVSSRLLCFVLPLSAFRCVDLGVIDCLASREVVGCCKRDGLFAETMTHKTLHIARC
jgi:hypothetical protein